MNEEDTTDETLSDESELSSADDKSTVGNIAKVIGEALGKEFPDDETALKSVKDTSDYVGKTGKAVKALEKLGLDPDKVLSGEEEPAQPTTPEIDTSKFVDMDTYNRDTFYAKNPGLLSMSKIIDAFAKTNGMTLDEAAKSEDLKPLFEKTNAYDELQSKKSVLETNPRLGAATDKLTTAKQQLKDGDDLGAKTNAVSAVMDLVDEK